MLPKIFVTVVVYFIVNKMYSFKVLLLLVVGVSMIFGLPAGYEDSDTAASGGDHHGRVQIKVYRGPGDHDDHAPWGFWVKQPADDDH